MTKHLVNHYPDNLILEVWSGWRGIQGLLRENNLIVIKTID